MRSSESMKTLTLHSPTVSFKASQDQNGPKNWYTFDVSFGTNEYTEVGSQDAETFIEPLIKTLTNKEGLVLNEQSGFVETVGIDSLYLGMFHITPGYTSFYFFRKLNYDIHIAMADGGGNLIDHAEVEPSEIMDWLKRLENFNNYEGEL